MAGQTWREEALDKLLDFVGGKAMTDTFFGTDVREFAQANGLVEPSETRAWGAVMQAAQKSGIIEQAGYAQSPNPASHKSPVSIWRRII